MATAPNHPNHRSEPKELWGNKYQLQEESTQYGSVKLEGKWIKDVECNIALAHIHEPKRY